MSTREKRLVFLLGCFAVFGVGIGVYTFVLSPWLENRATARELMRDLGDKTARLDELEAKKIKLKALYAQSLPGDPDVAQREYGALLYSMLGESRVPIGSYTVTPKEAADANRVPTTTGKTPAFTRTGYEIVMKKVKMENFVRFLEAYYRQPVLQQITHLNIKRSATEGSESASAKRNESRADLEVTIVTEAVIIDGAAKRETLLPVPTAFGAIGGSLGLGLVEYSPQFVMRIKPSVVASMLAPGRDYSALALKDPFHGPLPPPKAPPPPKANGDEKKIDEPVDPPEDISPYIRLTGITWRNDGTITAEIRDMANNYDYEVTRKFNIDGDLKVTVKKYFYINLTRKPLENMDEYLIIHEDETATDRKFKVLDFTAEGLLLSERPIVTKAADTPKEEKPKEEPKGSKSGSYSKGGNTKGGKTQGKKPEAAKGPQPLGAMVGSLAFIELKPTEVHYLWRIGSTLKKIEELPPPAGVAKTVEEAPMPRENPQGK